MHLKERSKTMKYRKGDKVTIVLDNVDMQMLNSGNIDVLLLIHPDQIIAHEPTKEISEETK